ncbi:MAG TPA: 50S ribosomal protein L29 [Candidatus Nanoarchaeia archaeon]|nr:50S ribosomal protein L29 [Candidatus Nanoarchaeia archaeon]
MKSKTSELRGMSTQLLEEKLSELKKNLMKINAQIATGTIPENPGNVRNIKKTVARILMIITEKKKEVPNKKANE